jgi:hypothetical protein
MEPLLGCLFARLHGGQACRMVTRRGLGVLQSFLQTHLRLRRLGLDLMQLVGRVVEAQDRQRPQRVEIGRVDGLLAVVNRSQHLQRPVQRRPAGAMLDLTSPADDPLVGTQHLKRNRVQQGAFLSRHIQYQQVGAMFDGRLCGHAGQQRCQACGLQRQRTPLLEARKDGRQALCQQRAVERAQVVAMPQHRATGLRERVAPDLHCTCTGAHLCLQLDPRVGVAFNQYQALDVELGVHIQRLRTSADVHNGA